MPIKRSESAVDVPAQALLSSDEASQFGALKRSLPEGWLVELRPDPDIVWVAFVYQADASRSSPLFIVCRRDNRVGLFMQWMGEAPPATMVFTNLWPTLELISRSVFAFMHMSLVTVPTEGWDVVQH